MPPPKREIPSPILGLIALLTIPLIVALYLTLFFTMCALAAHTFRWLQDAF